MAAVTRRLDLVKCITKISRDVQVLGSRPFDFQGCTGDFVCVRIFFPKKYGERIFFPDMQRRENFFSAIIRQFFQCRNFFRQVFPCKNFFPRNQSSGNFFLKSPISPPPPSQMVGSRMITRTRFSQKQVVRAREPASSFSHLGTSYC